MATPHITNTLLADHAPDTAVDTINPVREKRSATVEANKKQLAWADYVNRSLQKLATTGNEQSAPREQNVTIEEMVGI